MNHLPNQVPTRIGPVVERLHRLHPRLMDLSLERLQRLLAALDHPERRLPPVLHVAGTNGKGSTCAMLRGLAEAAGLSTHVFTSPHLVRFNERIRLAGTLVDDETLAQAFEHVEQVNAGAPITVFEVITAVALHLFASIPADLCILEVGLGGRGDATNVVPHPAATAVTSISLDHTELLGDTLAAIAREKAGIAKPGVPLVTGAQPGEALEALRDAAHAAGSPFRPRFGTWTIERRGDALLYQDEDGTLAAPLPSLPGPHQIDNAGIALATMRAARPGWSAVQGLARTVWPARLQRLHGRLQAALPPGWELWLDGGHNPAAAEALAAQMRQWQDAPLHLLVGLKQGKDAALVFRALVPQARTVWAVNEPGQHLAMSLADMAAASGGAARPGPDLHGALAQLPPAPFARVLICGSLYLAGEALRLDGTAVE